MTILLRITGVSALCLLAALPLDAQTLRGSPASVERQYRVAKEHDFTFLRTSQQVRQFADRGYLVHLPGNANYTLARVSHPYARPEVKLFVERLSAQYRAACGEQLVVTSLTRPLNGQPSNASPRSVHPTGMAIDLRVSQQPRCRSWLESTLLSLERTGVISATRERRPPHYHVSVFPRQYAQYVRSMGGDPSPAVASVGSLASQASQATVASASRLAPAVEYRVRRGDSLWSIARRHGLDVDTLKTVNRLNTTRIYAGQTLQIPAESR
jgi:LysM repeat protein